MTLFTRTQKAVEDLNKEITVFIAEAIICGMDQIPLFQQRCQKLLADLDSHSSNVVISN